MATMKVDTNRFPKVLFQLDGDDSTPAADTVAAYVAADGTLHLVDEAGTDTEVGGGAVADILDLPTAETDDTLVLAPDGAGGVEFRAESGGGGGGSPTTPVLLQTVRTNGNATIAPVPAGNRIIVAIVDYGGTVTGVACTNVTFAQIGTDVTSGGNKLSVWVGVATGTSGTSVTFTGSGTILNLIVEVADAVDTLDVQASTAIGSGFALLSANAAGTTPGAFVVCIGMTDNTSNITGAMLSVPFVSFPTALAVQACCAAYGYAPTGDVTGFAVTHGGSSGATLVVSIV